jgi:RES domain-containing protein
MTAAMPNPHIRDVLLMSSPGQSPFYASSHFSLWVLELFVHLPAVLRLNIPDFEAVRVSIPDDAGITRIGVDEMEMMLGASDPEAACRAAGDAWIAAGHALIFAAPSIIVPEDLNLMLNPAHPRMHDVTIVSTRRFRFDARLVSLPH